MAGHIMEEIRNFCMPAATSFWYRPPAADPGSSVQAAACRQQRSSSSVQVLGNSTSSATLGMRLEHDQKQEHTAAELGALRLKRTACL